MGSVKDKVTPILGFITTLMGSGHLRPGADEEAGTKPRIRESVEKDFIRCKGVRVPKQCPTKEVPT